MVRSQPRLSSTRDRGKAQEAETEIETNAKAEAAEIDLEAEAKLQRPNLPAIRPLLIFVSSNCNYDPDTTHCWLLC